MRQASSYELAIIIIIIIIIFRFQDFCACIKHVYMYNFLPYYLANHFQEKSKMSEYIST